LLDSSSLYFSNNTPLDYVAKEAIFRALRNTLIIEWVPRMTKGRYDRFLTGIPHVEISCFKSAFQRLLHHREGKAGWLDQNGHNLINGER